MLGLFRDPQYHNVRSFGWGSDLAVLADLLGKDFARHLPQRLFDRAFDEAVIGLREALGGMLRARASQARVGSEAASPAVGLEKHEKAGLTCQSCHKESPPQAVVPGAQCMICHGDLKKLIEKSIKAIPNPHASPHIAPGEQPKCEECHHIHKPSEVSCYSCHQDFKYKMP
jgi:hypothetical protein